MDVDRTNIFEFPVRRFSIEELHLHPYQAGTELVQRQLPDLSRRLRQEVIFVATEEAAPDFGFMNPFPFPVSFIVRHDRQIVMLGSGPGGKTRDILDAGEKTWIYGAELERASPASGRDGLIRGQVDVSFLPVPSADTLAAEKELRAHFLSFVTQMTTDMQAAIPQDQAADLVVVQRVFHDFLRKIKHQPMIGTGTFIYGDEEYVHMLTATAQAVAGLMTDFFRYADMDVFGLSDIFGSSDPKKNGGDFQA